MLLSIEFLNAFTEICKGTTIDVHTGNDETIENLKVRITLFFTELKTKTMVILFNGKPLTNQETLKLIGVKEGDTIQVKRKKSKKRFCCWW